MKKLSKLLILMLSIVTLSLPMTVAAFAGEEAAATTEVGGEGGGDGTVSPNKPGDENTVYIEETGNAIDDILNNERFQGSVGSISNVTGFVDKYFIWFISISAFLIISVALLKNVLAGVYCSNTSFWDKVSEAHQQLEQKDLNALIGKFSGGNFRSIKPADISTFIFGLVPNVKAWTDFAEEDGKTVDPKAYFMRSIPAMIFCVIIGVFIYNGYYRDTAATVGGFGAEMFERTLTAADPVALADRAFSMTGTPKSKFATLSGANNRVKNKIAKSVYSAVVSQYSDITDASSKRSLMTNIEGLVDKITCDDFSDDQFKWSVKCQAVVKGDANDRSWSTETSDSSKTRKGSMVKYMPLINLVDSDVNTNKTTEYDNIQVTITGTRDLTVVVTRDKKGGEDADKSAKTESEKDEESKTKSGKTKGASGKEVVDAPITR